MDRNSMEDIVNQQISAAIDALMQAKAMLARGEVNPHLETAAYLINDAHFNAQLLGMG